MDIVILPSLLAADCGRLGDEARRAAAAGADEVHLDIMDGHFVPNLSFGPDVVAMARQAVPHLPRNVHLMLSQPDVYAPRFLDAGANTVLIHVEAACDVAATLRAIRARNARAGLTLKPATPAEALDPFLDQIDEVLVMTVEPGYGGQKFMAEMLPKVGLIRRQADAAGFGALTIMVDGGIATDTAAACAAWGANAFVAGTSLFRAPDMPAAVAAMRRAASENYGRSL